MFAIFNHHLNLILEHIVCKSSGPVNFSIKFGSSEDCFKKKVLDRNLWVSHRFSIVHLFFGLNQNKLDWSNVHLFFEMNLFIKNIRYDCVVDLCSFDFCVTLSAIVGLLLQLAHSGFYYIVVLRPFRLFR